VTGGEDKLETGITSYVALAWPLFTNTVLLCAGLLFIVRLYLVERRFEEGLIGFEREYLKRKINADFKPLPEEEWFLAHGFEYQVATTSQCRRLGRLRKVAKFLVVTAMSIVALFGAGALFAATSTGSLTVSAIVLSRCIIRFPSFTGKAETACSDGVSVTKTVGDRKANSTAQSSVTSPQQSVAPNAGQEITTVTLTY
jgi:hypothetical protein